MPSAVADALSFVGQAVLVGAGGAVLSAALQLLIEWLAKRKT